MFFFIWMCVMAQAFAPQVRAVTTAAVESFQAQVRAHVEAPALASAPMALGWVSEDDAAIF